MSGGDDFDSDTFRYSYYEFRPSKTLPIVAAALFGVALIAHVVLAFRFKTWRRMWPFILGVAAEVGGYATRWFSVDNPYSRGLYICTILLIILAPAFMAASEYMIFGYVVNLVGPQHSPIRPSRVTFIFVFFDVLSLVVQGGGGGLFASDDLNVIKTGRAILIVGLCIQLIAFGIFWIFAVIFQRRLRRAGILSRSLDYLLYTLYLGCFFILLRSIFRCVEFGASENGNGGYLVTTEGFYYGLEALPILIAVFIFVFSYPGYWLRRIEMEFPTPAAPAVATQRADPETGATASNEVVDEKSAEELQREREGRRRKWWGGRR